MKRIVMIDFFNSETAVSKGVDNLQQFFDEPNFEKMTWYISILKTFLNSLQQHLNRQITVTSGYRCEWLNRLVHGSRTSWHMLGQAVDFQIDNMQSIPNLEEEIRSFYATIFAKYDYDFVIEEIIFYENFIHLAIGPKIRK